jgi:hypothetical protein
MGHQDKNKVKNKNKVKSPALTKPRLGRGTLQ